MKKYHLHKKFVPQLDEDLQKYDVALHLRHFSQTKRVNIKRVIYRSITLFVSALGRSYGVRKHSSFEIVDELKRRNLLSKAAAQKLSLAVAVACHIRLVYYSSKNRQDDIIYKEDEFEGRGKFQELTKIVNKIWLTTSLATAESLQTLLSRNIHIGYFDNMLIYHRTLPISMMAMQGLYRENINYSEHVLQKLPSLHPRDCLGLASVYISCGKLREFEKGAKLLLTIRRKLENPYQAADHSLLELEKATQSQKIHQYTENTLKVLDAISLSRLGKYSHAFKITEEILKTNAVPNLFAMTSLCNIHCKIVLHKSHESLSSIRDLLKTLQIEKSGYFGERFLVYVIRLITYALLGIKKKEQGLHWAKQGLNFVEERDFTSYYVQLYSNLVKHIVTKNAQGLALQLYLEHI